MQLPTLKSTWTTQWTSPDTNNAKPERESVSSALLIRSISNLITRNKIKDVKDLYNENNKS